MSKNNRNGKTSFEEKCLSVFSVINFIICTINIKTHIASRLFFIRSNMMRNIQFAIFYQTLYRYSLQIKSLGSRKQIRLERKI